MNVSVVIVNFNCASLVDACVESLRRVLGGEVEIIVVDNASDFSDREQLKLSGAKRGFRVILADENRGFAAGCNLGARAARSKWLHFLNPDCVVAADALAVYESLEQLPCTAIYTTRMRDSTGRIRGNVYAVPKLANLVRTIFGLDSFRWAQGSSILITAENLWALGGWDESYFMYAEDLDLCYRAHLYGLPLRVLDMNVMHSGGGSSERVWTSAERERRVYRAQRLFFAKHGSLLEYVCVTPLLIARGAIAEHKSPMPAVRAFCASLGSQRHS